FNRLLQTCWHYRAADSGLRSNVCRRASSPFLLAPLCKFHGQASPHPKNPLTLPRQLASITLLFPASASVRGLAGRQRSTKSVRSRDFLSLGLEAVRGACASERSD